MKTFLSGRHDPLIVKVIEALRGIPDSQYETNIYDLGLIRDIDSDSHGNISVTMVLRDDCPRGTDLACDVQDVVLSTEHVASCAILIVNDPPWTRDCIVPEIRNTIFDDPKIGIAKADDCR